MLVYKLIFLHIPVFWLWKDINITIVEQIKRFNIWRFLNELENLNFRLTFLKTTCMWLGSLLLNAVHLMYLETLNSIPLFNWKIKQASCLDDASADTLFWLVKGKIIFYHMYALKICIIINSRYEIYYVQIYMHGSLLKWPGTYWQWFGLFAFICSMETWTSE